MVVIFLIILPRNSVLGFESLFWPQRQPEYELSALVRLADSPSDMFTAWNTSVENYTTAHDIDSDTLPDL